MTFTVKTNHVPRDVIDAYQLTAKEREEFDYLDWPAIEEGTDSASFFRYRGTLYDLGEFTALEHAYFGIEELAKEWDGIMTESSFSALVLKYANNYESVIVGYIYS